MHNDRSDRRRAPSAANSLRHASASQRVALMTSDSSRVLARSASASASISDTNGSGNKSSLYCEQTKGIRCAAKRTDETELAQRGAGGDGSEHDAAAERGVVDAVGMQRCQRTVARQQTRRFDEKLVSNVAILSVDAIFW